MMPTDDKLKARAMDLAVLAGTSLQGIEHVIEASLRETAREARREACTDVCAACGGRLPQYQRDVEGPNAAGNYTHRPKPNCHNANIILCTASSIKARLRALAESEEG